MKRGVLIIFIYFILRPQVIRRWLYAFELTFRDAWSWRLGIRSLARKYINLIGDRMHLQHLNFLLPFNHILRIPTEILLFFYGFRLPFEDGPKQFFWFVGPHLIITIIDQTIIKLLIYNLLFNLIIQALLNTINLVASIIFANNLRIYSNGSMWSLFKQFRIQCDWHGEHIRINRRDWDWQEYF